MSHIVNIKSQIRDPIARDRGVAADLGGGSVPVCIEGRNLHPGRRRKPQSPAGDAGVG